MRPIFLAAWPRVARSTIAIVAVSQAAGLVPLAVLLILLPSSPVQGDFVWGAVAGVAGSIGVSLLYRALAVGTMSVVAPTTAVCAVLLPVLVEAVRGERLAPVTMGGIALALVAIVLIGQSSFSDALTDSIPGADTVRPARRRALPPGLDLAFLSGIAIGLFFLALARTSPDAGLWPLLASRSLCLVLFGGYVIATAGTLRLPQPVLGMTICVRRDRHARQRMLRARHPRRSRSASS